MTVQEDWLVLTRRLGLRLLEARDGAALRGLAEDAWFAGRPGPESADRLLSPWAIVRRDTGTVIGYCGFFVRPVKGTTMGYAIIPGQRGQGFATEAAAAVLAWAEQHGIDVYASIRPPNPASVRVLEKIGMRLTATYTDEDGPRHVYRHP